MTTLPTLTCRRLVNNDWSQAESITLTQAWLPAVQPEYRPATVRTGWNATALLVAADLLDTDIFNPLTDFNGLAYTKGDVFEIFLQPVGQAAYFEFHIGPANQKLQLRFPAPGILHQTGLKSEYYITQPIIQSTVNIHPDRWTVQAEIPLNLVQETGPVAPGTQWRFNFCRYDYTRGQKQPVLSSTSPHRELSFHRLQEWGVLTFA